VNGKQRIKAIRAVFPRYDQPLDSKCKYPERYGIMRVPEAEEIANGITPDSRTRPVREFRTKPYKHTFWLEESQEGRMHKARRLLGTGGKPASVQSVIEKALALYFEQMEKA